MSVKKRVLIAMTVGATFVVAVGVGSLSGVSRAQADDDADGGRSRIRIGFEVAPVPLDLAGKNPQLVGLGSYLVNVVDHCNTCHSAGPSTEFAKGGNPYFKGNEQAELIRLREELKRVQGEIPLVYPLVDSDAVAEIVANWTGIPIGKMVRDEIQTVLSLSDKMAERVIGQKHARWGTAV